MDVQWIYALEHQKQGFFSSHLLMNFPLLFVNLIFFYFILCSFSFIRYFMERIALLQQNGVEPLVVFDGDYLPMKAGKELEREQ